MKAGKALDKLHLIDSSTISMCLNGYEWADFRDTKAGIKLHTSIRLCDDTVSLDQMILTPARPADETRLDELIVYTKDVLHVFDRGYFNFVKFDTYSKKRNQICDTHQKQYSCKHHRRITSRCIFPITRHAIVTLGKMKNQLQLVETMDSNGNKIRIVCNDAKRSALEISDIYRNRWKIELFFKWVKQHLVIKNFMARAKMQFTIKSILP